jgi:hypothetical protein
MQPLGSFQRSSLWRRVTSAFAEPDTGRTLSHPQSEDFSGAYKLGYERFQYPSCTLVPE